MQCRVQEQFIKFVYYIHRKTAMQTRALHHLNITQQSADPDRHLPKLIATQSAKKKKSAFYTYSISQNNTASLVVVFGGWF